MLQGSTGEPATKRAKVEGGADAFTAWLVEKGAKFDAVQLRRAAGGVSVFAKSNIQPGSEPVLTAQ
jgi:hypothetical protein